MASLLAERPRTGPGGSSSSHRHRTEPHRDDTDSGWLRRLRDRRPDAGRRRRDHPGGRRRRRRRAPVRLDPQTLPPVPPVRPVGQAGTPLPPAALGGDTIDAARVAPPRRRLRRAPGGPQPPPRRPGAVLVRSGRALRRARRRRRLRRLRRPADRRDRRDDEDGARRHRFVVIGLPLLALLVVIALAWWVGNRTVLASPTPSTRSQGSTPVGERTGRTARPRPRRPPATAVPIVEGRGLRPAGRRRPRQPRRRAARLRRRRRRPPGRPTSTGARRPSATSRTASACCSTSAAPRSWPASR